MLSKLGNLNEPERIKTLICTYPVSEARKQLLTDAYDYYVRYRGLSWIKPKFVREDKPIFLPLEVELDQLIANAYPKMSIFLQFLKETGADSGEAWKTQWKDIDVKRKTASIRPTKNHNSRTLPISENLLSRLLTLAPNGIKGNIWNCRNLDRFRWRYERHRNELCKKLNNPRLHEIAFRNFRHWKATFECYKTKDILHVKWFLGHKRIENTLVYTHLVNFESDEYHCRTAKTIEEAKALIECGFEYVTQMDGAKLFRKRK